MMLARYPASALLFRLRINPQVEHRLNGHTRRRHCRPKVGFRRCDRGCKLAVGLVRSADADLS